MQEINLFFSLETQSRITIDLLWFLHSLVFKTKKKILDPLPWTQYSRLKIQIEDLGSPAQEFKIQTEVQLNLESRAGDPTASD